MIRILIATALLVAAFSINAMAADVNVTVTVGAVQTIAYHAGNGVSFSAFTSSDLDAGTKDSAATTSWVGYAANVASKIVYTTTPSANATTEGLALNVTGSVGGGANASFSSGNNVVASFSGSKQTEPLGFSVDHYTVTGVDWDTPTTGTYTFDVTYTIGNA